ncbi:hypothetical protein AYI70_g9466, partial [Smittium culicis]
MSRNNSGSNRTTRSLTSASSSAPANNSASNIASAPTTRSRRPPANRGNRLYGYQRSTPARNSTVFFPFSEGSDDMVYNAVPHYSAASIDPPVTEIADNDSSDRSDAPPPYSLLPPQNNLSDIPESKTEPAITPVASSSRRPAPFSVTTLVPSSTNNRNLTKNGITMDLLTDPPPILVPTLQPTQIVGHIHHTTIQKKLKAIEELTGIRNTSVNPFELVVLKGIKRKPITEVKRCFIDLEVYIDMIGNIKFVEDRTEIL